MCHRWYGGGCENYEKLKTEFKKNSSVQFKETGFDQFNVVLASSLAQDEEFSVPQNATKAQIKNSFSKMLGKKKTNKKLLSNFITLVA
jgi:FKBP-type peptidyl-prolyl cis-trans isomerase (trigger factor)